MFKCLCDNVYCLAVGSSVSSGLERMWKYAVVASWRYSLALAGASEQILKHLSWLPVGGPICVPGCCRLYYKRGIVTAD